MAVKKIKGKGNEISVKRDGKNSGKKVFSDDIEEDEERDDGESDADIEFSLEEAEEEVKKLRNVLGDDEENAEKIELKGSKPISEIKKGDKIKVDGVQFEVDAHYVLIEHGKTKEMTIEIFNPKTDKDYQLRYFSDRAENSIEFYELQEIVYVRKQCKKVEW